MKHYLPVIWATLAAFPLVGAVMASTKTQDTDAAKAIIAMERAALDRWGKGDPDGFLEISDESVVYFDPFTERRLNGRDALKKLYDSFRGQASIDSYELIDPKVEIAGDMAVLTFNFVSHGKGETWRWNTTEVYQRKNGNWRIIHTHWSLTQPKLQQKQD